MKNLKLFVAPLLGVTLLVGCGPKSMDVNDFRAKVEEKFNLDAIKQACIGKKQHITGTYIGETVNSSLTISDVVLVAIPGGGAYYDFAFGTAGSSLSNYGVLSTELINTVFEMMYKQSGMTVNYFISGDTYTIEAKKEQQGLKSSMKYVYNKDLVITHSETSASGQSQGSSVNVNANLNYTYEN